MYRNFKDIYKYGYSDSEFWEEIKKVLKYEARFRPYNPAEPKQEDRMESICDAVNELSMEPHHPFYYIKKSNTGRDTELICEYVGDVLVNGDVCSLVTIVPKIEYNLSKMHNGVIAVFGRRCALLLHRYCVQTIDDKVRGCTYWINSPLKIFAGQMKVDLDRNYDNGVDLSECGFVHPYPNFMQSKFGIEDFVHPYRNYIQSKPGIEGTVELLDNIKEMIFELSDMVDEVKLHLTQYEQCTTKNEKNER